MVSSVVGDAAPEGWRCVPFEHVGPIRFGMGLAELATVMAELGYISEGSVLLQPHGPLTHQVRYRSPDHAWPLGEAVTVYHHELAGVAAVAVDALSGPQVYLDGIPLVGRAPSEVTEQVHRYAEERGMVPCFSNEGDAAVGVGAAGAGPARRGRAEVAGVPGGEV